jgi:hypothetical protein
MTKLQNLKTKSNFKLIWLKNGQQQWLQWNNRYNQVIFVDLNHKTDNNKRILSHFWLQ